MAKKHQSRPTIAARKKVAARKDAERRSKYTQYRKPALIGLGILVAAVLLIILAVDFFHTPNGSIRDVAGQLIGVNGASIVRQFDDGRYYELGSMKTPDGYTSDAYELFANSDAKEQSHYFVTTDETKAINNVYVAGVKNKSGEEMLETVRTQNNTYNLMNDNREAVIAGHTVHYLYASSGASEEDESLRTAQIIAYVDTVQDSCVLLSCSSVKTSEELLPTEEQMVAELEGLLACLTIPAK